MHQRQKTPQRARKSHQKAIRPLRRSLTISGQKWSWATSGPYLVSIQSPQGVACQVDSHKILDSSFEAYYSAMECHKVPEVPITPGDVVRWIRMNLIPNPLTPQSARQALNKCLRAQGLRRSTPMR